MAIDKTAALEQKIAELEAQIRGVAPAVTGKLGDVLAFSAGSCTNECTAACTIGCTKGCTGASCATQSLDDLVTQPAVNPAVTDAAMAGAQLFRSLAGR